MLTSPKQAAAYARFDEERKKALQHWLSVPKHAGAFRCS
jgi:hypothetical protein